MSILEAILNKDLVKRHKVEPSAIIHNETTSESIVYETKLRLSWFVAHFAIYLCSNLQLFAHVVKYAA